VTRELEQPARAEAGECGVDVDVPAKQRAQQSGLAGAGRHRGRVKNAFFGTGTGVNYSPAEGVYASLASNQYGNTTITLRPNTRLRIQQTYFYTRLAHVFTNHIFRNTVNYQFSPALSLRAIIDYNAVLANTALADYDTSKKFTGDLLLAYLPHPGTAVYMGYTNSRENLALIGEPATLVRTTMPDLQIGSQVFVKVSYLFRF